MMPKLPDVQSFGARPQLQGRGVPSSEGAAGGLMRAVEISGRSAQEEAQQVGRLGEGFLRTSEILQQAQERKQERYDAIAQILAVRKLDQEMSETIKETTVGGNWADPNTIEGFLGKLNGRTQAIFDEAGVSEKNAPRVLNALEAKRASFEDTVSALHLKESHDQVYNHYSMEADKLGKLTYASPAQFTSVMMAIDYWRPTLAAAMPASEVETAIRGWKSNIAVMAVDRMLADNDPDSAATFLDTNKDAIENVPMDISNKLHDRIGMKRMEMVQEDKLTVAGQGSWLFDKKGNVIAKVPSAPNDITQGDVMGSVLLKAVRLGKSSLNPAEKELYEAYTSGKLGLLGMLFGGAGVSGESAKGEASGNDNQPSATNKDPSEMTDEELQAELDRAQ